MKLTDFKKGLIITSLPLLLLGLFMAKPVKASEYVLTDQGTAYEGSCHVYGNMGAGGKIPNHNGDGYNAYWYVSNLGDAIPHKISIHWNGARVLLTTNTDLDSYYQISFSYPSDPTGINGYGFGLYLCSGTDTYPSEITISDVSPAIYPEVVVNGLTGYNGKDFSKWNVTYQRENATECLTGTYYIGVRYGLSTSTYIGDDFIETNQTGECINSNWTFDIVKRNPLWYPPLNSSTTWYVQPYIRHDDYLFLGSFTQIIINANETTDNINQWVYDPISGAYSTSSNLIPGFDPKATSTFSLDGQQYIECVDSDSLFSSWGCYLQISLMKTLTWFFQPGENAQRDLQNIIYTLKGTFPFSIPLAVLDETKENINGSYVVDYTDSTISIPQIGIEKQLLSSTTLRDTLINSRCDLACATQISNDIFSAQKMIIWLGTAILAITIVL